MCLVIFGFMWLNQPSEEELAQQRKKAQQEQLDAQRQSKQQAGALVDTLSAEELADLKSIIRQYSTDSAHNTIGNNELTLTLKG